MRKLCVITLTLVIVVSVRGEMLNCVMKYLNDNTNTAARIGEDFMLRDDGGGQYISKWNVAGIAEPTTNDLPTEGEAGNWTTNYWPVVEVGSISEPVYMIWVGSGGIDSKGRGKFKGADIEAMDPNYGLILTATNASKWLVWVGTNGNLQTTQIAGSPEVAWTTRVSRLKQQRSKLVETKKQWNDSIGVGAKATLSNRVIQLEKLLGLRDLDSPK